MQCTPGMKLNPGESRTVSFEVIPYYLLWEEAVTENEDLKSGPEIGKGGGVAPRGRESGSKQNCLPLSISSWLIIKGNVTILVLKIVRPEHNHHTRLKRLNFLHRHWTSMKVFLSRGEWLSSQVLSPIQRPFKEASSMLKHHAEHVEASWPAMPVPHPGLPGLLSPVPHTPAFIICLDSFYLEEWHE